MSPPNKIQIDNPTQNLESYFLEVVRQAKESLAETSGATSGSRVAAYLRGDAEAAPATDKILERLTHSAAPKPAAPAPASAKGAPKIDQAKLESLAKPAAPAAPPPPAPPRAAPGRFQQSQPKASSLLGQPDEK